MRERYEKVVAWSANIDFEKKLDNKLIYYGIEALHNKVKSEAEKWDTMLESSSPSATRYPDGKNNYFSLSAYTGVKLNFSNKFILNTGIRYNYIGLHSTIEDNSFYNFPFTTIDISNGAITGSVGLVFLPDNSTRINLNMGSGFRAPNLDDAGKVFDSEPGNVVVPNPDLKPEYAYNADLGIAKDLWQFVKLELTAYVTLLNNAMVRRDFNLDGNDSIIYGGEISKVLAIVNSGEAFVYGTHASMQIVPNRYFKLKSNINFTRGKDQDGIPLRHVSPLYGSTHIIYERKKFKSDLYAIYNGELSYEELAPSEQDKDYMYALDNNNLPYSPSWFTLNLKTSYQLGTFGILNAGIENLLNYRYRPYSSGIVAPGRNFILSLRVYI